MTAEPELDLEAELDLLFGLPPDEFIAARNALAGRLRGLGRRAEADAVRALRRPSLALWATNQLARRHPDEVASLLESSARLRTAQSTGASAADLRDAAAARRGLVARLSARAGDILAAEGVPAPGPHLERVTRTLMGAGEDDAGADALGRGRLTQELAPSGFGAMGVVAPAAAAPAEDDAAEEDRRRAERAQHAEELARVARAAEAEAARLEGDASAAEAAARRARRAADAARARADDARSRSDEAARSLR